jgi:hypothetical protein
MWGMDPQGTQIDPDEAMEKINKDPKYYEAFMEIFKDNENLIKRNCCCGDIDIKLTMLPKDQDNSSEAVPLTIHSYITYRFEIKDNGAKVVYRWNLYHATCKALDTLILSIYKAQSPS